MYRAGPHGIDAGMHAARAAKTALALLLCACFAAGADEPAAEPEAQQTVAEANPAAEESKEFKPPPGYRRKQHGDVTLYCRREAVLGSRFKAEKCYDQAGVEALQRAERENLETLERIRNCSVGSCPGG